MRLFGYPYNDLVICKDSPDYLGVFKLLDKIDVSKASGPDCIPGRILQNLARKLALALHFIFEQSLNTGDLPAEWTLANVAPIFKKGSKLPTCRLYL